jgi:hypothetical protein
MLGILLSAMLVVGTALIRGPRLSRIVLPSATGFLALMIFLEIGLPIMFFLSREELANAAGTSHGAPIAKYFIAWAFAWGIGVISGAWLGHIRRTRASGRQTDEENASSAGWALVVMVAMAVPASILAYMLMLNLPRLGPSFWWH